MRLTEKQAERREKSLLAQIEFTRVDNDVNGNPRYVFHFLALINERDEEFATVNSDIMHGKSSIQIMYEIALKKAKKIGGRKFHNKQFGGGIVIQSYNTLDDKRRILELKEN